MVQQHPLHDLTSGHVTYTMVDKNKVRGIPGVFGGAVSIGRNILCPQTYKKTMADPEHGYRKSILVQFCGSGKGNRFGYSLW